MKNLLIISSSPRRNGNSQLLCNQFMQGAQYKGHHVDMIRIMDQNIGFCRACDGCVRNGGTCILKDDMAGSLTVVSNFSLTKSLKTLIISMLLSFFIVKFAKINVLIRANVCYNRHRR